MLSCRRVDSGEESERKEAMPSLQDTLFEGWATPVSESPLWKDLGRLYSRFTIFTSDGVAHTFVGDGGPPRSPMARANSLAALKGVRDVMLVLTMELEGEDSFLEKEAQLNSIIFSDGAEEKDREQVIPTMLEILGEDSRMMRILKFTHQNVVLSAMSHLKDPHSGVLANFMTKDVRESHGWRIVISLEGPQAQVWHRRREMNANPWGTDSESFEVEWELRVTLEREEMVPKSASLRITDLHIGETTDETRAEEIRNALIGNLIIQ